jgi:hypothetical protein
MEPLLQPSTLSTQTIPGSRWRGFGRGLVPLVILAGFSVITLALTLATKQIADGIDFATRDWLVAGTIIIGLIASAVAYIVALVATFRRWRTQAREGDNAGATGMLWALIVTALVVVVPVVVAALVPQHPAP